MPLSKTLYLLLSTGSTQKDLSHHDGKIVDWDLKNQIKQSKAVSFNMLYYPFFMKHLVIVIHFVWFDSLRPINNLSVM